MSIRASRLYQDLHADSRDLMYRAMMYIARCGGPTIIGSPDARTNLLASRGPMLEWLLGRPDRGRILEEYAEYLERWSPVFND
jgi:hypothetical protein